jgi:translation machinery-associated protein 16
VCRDDDELDKLKAARRPGRPASNKQDLLQIKVDKEKKEYKEGFTVPDLTDKQTVEGLKKWNGTPGGINVLKFIRVAENATELPDSHGDMQME